MAEISLFNSSIIPESISKSLPEGYVIRSLQRGDYKLGHLDVLKDLTYVGQIPEEQWIERFDAMKASNGTYYIVVIADERDPSAKRLIGTGTLVAERKFFCELATQGHIEDIAIAKDHQGKKFGTCLIQTLDHLGKHLGFYKNILNCSEGKDKFYTKCGYEEAGFEMENYFDPKAQAHGV